MIIDKLINLKTDRVRKIGMGIFDNEDDLMVATKRMHTMGVPIIDVFTPYPIHNLDKAFLIQLMSIILRYFHENQ